MDRPVPCAITYWSGLKEVVVADVRERAGPVAVKQTLRGARHEALIADVRAEPADLLALRSVEDVFALGRSFAGVPTSGPKALARIEELLAEVDLAGALEVVARARGEELGEAPSYTLSVHVAGGHHFEQEEARRLARRRLNEALHWRYEPEGYRVNVRFQIMRDRGFLGLALGRGPMSRRPYALAARPGSLEPPLAYCVARLSRPGPDELFVDPLCGAGTIAIERALGWPARRVLCGDLAHEAALAARRNAREAGAQVGVARWDALCLPLPAESVDAAATNLPYGEEMPLGEPQLFIEVVMPGIARVLRAGARLAVVTAHGRQLKRWARRGKLFRTERELSVPLHGFDATILVLRRRASYT